MVLEEKKGCAGEKEERTGNGAFYILEHSKTPRVELIAVIMHHARQADTSRSTKIAATTMPVKMRRNAQRSSYLTLAMT